MDAYIFLAEGFEESEAIITIDLLRRADINIRSVSITKTRMVTSSHGVAITADLLFSETDFRKSDLLILPGGMPGTKNLSAHKGLTKLLIEQNQSGKLIAAICAAPSILGKLGLLKGKKAVCFPGFESELKGADVRFEKKQIDGNTITSRGAGCAIEFALLIIETLKGKATADNVAQNIIFN